MNILEAAEQIRKEAERVADEKGITVQEAFSYAIKKFESKYNLV